MTEAQRWECHVCEKWCAVERDTMFVPERCIYKERGNDRKPLWAMVPMHSSAKSDAVLDELQLWRMKRMNGTLKKDVWQAWNEETDYINELRSQQKESEQG